MKFWYTMYWKGSNGECLHCALSRKRQKGPAYRRSLFDVSERERTVAGEAPCKARQKIYSNLFISEINNQLVK